MDYWTDINNSNLRVKSHTLGITNKLQKTGRVLNEAHKKGFIQNGIGRRAQRQRQRSFHTIIGWNLGLPYVT